MQLLRFDEPPLEFLKRSVALRHGGLQTGDVRPIMLQIRFLTSDLRAGRSDSPIQRSDSLGKLSDGLMKLSKLPIARFDCTQMQDIEGATPLTQLR